MNLLLICVDMTFIQYDNKNSAEMKFHYNNEQSLGPITDKYANVYLHLGEKNNPDSIIKANKVILAMRSPYFHRIFQSRENIQSVDMGFVGVQGSIIRDAVNLIYGGTIEILDKQVGRFSNFLKLLELDFKMTKNEEGNINLPILTLKTKSTGIENETKKMKHQEEEVTEERDNEMMKNLSPEMHVSSPSEIADGTCMAPAVCAPVVIEFLSPKPTVGASFQGSSSSSSNKRTSKEICSDNWTETSSTGLDVELKKIDFQIGKSTSKGVGHKEYICCHCSFVVKDIFNARLHYIKAHQNSDEEQKTIMEVIKYQKEVIEEVKKLELDIIGDCNKTLAVIELETIVENLQARLISLGQMDDKNLPPNLTRKRVQLTKFFSELSAKLQDYIINL